MKSNNHNAKLKCSECRRSIGYGADLIAAEKCVSGPRGIVPLGGRLVFCSETCVGHYYGDSDLSELPSLPPRIP